TFLSKKCFSAIILHTVCTFTTCRFIKIKLCHIIHPLLVSYPFILAFFSIYYTNIKKHLSLERCLYPINFMALTRELLFLFCTNIFFWFFGVNIKINIL